MPFFKCSITQTSPIKCLATAFWVQVLTKVKSKGLILKIFRQLLVPLKIVIWKHLFVVYFVLLKKCPFWARFLQILQEIYMVCTHFLHMILANCKSCRILHSFKLCTRNIQILCMILARLAGILYKSDSDVSLMVSSKIFYYII